MRNRFAGLITIYLVIIAGVSEVGASITSQLVPSRTSGVAPLAIFFDGTATTASTTAKPFHELNYSWDFGDPASGNWSTSGNSKNRAKGPIAVHVFEQPGTYVVTLTVRNSQESVSRQVTISISDPNVVFSGKTYYVSANGADTNNGLSPSSPVKTFSKAVSFTNLSSRILFKRGDSFSTSSKTLLSFSGPGIIGAYYNSDGSDNPSMPKPIINQSGATSVFDFTANGPDWRIMDLDLRGPGTTSLEAAVQGGGDSPQNRSLLLRVTASSFKRGFLTAWSSVEHDDNHIVDCIFSNIVSYGAGMYFCGKRSSVIGTTCTGITGNISHIIRIWHGRKMVISENMFLDPGDGMLTIKCHNEIDVHPPLAQHIIISNNELRGKDSCLVVGPQNTTSYEELSDVIIESNLVHSSVKTGVLMDIFTRNITIRNNVLIGTVSSVYFVGISVNKYGVSPAPDNVYIFNNTFFKADNGQEFIPIQIFSDPTNTVVRNNLAVTTNFTGYQEVILDNFSSSTTASNNILRENLSDLVNGLHGDFRLVSSSNLINAGFSAPVCLDDHDGTPRPQSSAWDIGAFEYVSGASIDTTLPSVTITFPTGGSTLSGVVTITAIASDNVGVVAVQFRINGVNIGFEDTAQPFSVNWDTTAISDGSYNISAVARDAAGNSITSSAVSVNVFNNAVDLIPPAPPTGLRVQ